MTMFSIRRAMPALVAALLLGSQASALAKPASPVPAGKQARPTILSLSTSKLSGTVLSNGSNGGSALNPGFTTIKSVTVKCKLATGCLLAIDSMVQVAPPAGTNWAICPSVDGTYASPPCPFQGALPAVNSFITGNGRSTYAVATGTHTVNLDVYVDQASTLYHWDSDVSIYAP